MDCPSTYLGVPTGDLSPDPRPMSTLSMVVSLSTTDSSSSISFLVSISGKSIRQPFISFYSELYTGNLNHWSRMTI